MCQKLWNFFSNLPVQGPDVIQCVNAGRKASVKAEDLIVHESRERKVIEQVGEVLPHVGVAVLAQALVVESVNLANFK